MNRTKIEYLDYTLNLVVGCSGIGCAVRLKCWAAKQAKRKKHYCNLCYEFKPHFHMERLNQPLSLKKPSRIGLNFMGETFDTEFQSLNNRSEARENLEFIIDMITQAKKHLFFLFTKQPQNIPYDLQFPRNLIVCVSVNTQDDVWRIEALKLKYIAMRGVSFEPLYEEINVNLSGIDWIVIGAQTRPLLRPNKLWVEKLEAEAARLGIPVFEKKNLGYPVLRKELPSFGVEKS